MTGPGIWAAVSGAGDGLDDCAGYVVMVTDRATGEVDGYGPMTGDAALAEAHRVGRDLRDQRLSGITVRVVRLHTPDDHGP